MPYLKVQLVNDWGHNSYWTKVKKTKPFGTISAAEQDPEHALVAGQIVEVQWPDGHAKEYRILSKGAMTVVEQQDVYTTELFIEEVIHGVKMLVPLQSIKVWR